MPSEELNKENIEENEKPETIEENREQKEMSLEEFYIQLENEKNTFKTETADELNKANSNIDLDQDKFEEIKNETGVEQELNTINQEAEKYINETQKLIKEKYAEKEPSLENKIKNVENSAELYEVLIKNSGIQGSSEFYSADDMIDRLIAYFNDEANITVITQTAGLREKVKELKDQQELLENKEKPSYFAGKQVTIRRSSGDIEKDWRIRNDEPRIGANGEKIFYVYKGELQNPKLQLKEGTIDREVYEEELNELN
jgi:hypothetical protein